MLHIPFMLVKLFYFSIENVEEANSKIGYLLLDIKVWMLRRKLKLNDRETEICCNVGVQSSYLSSLVILVFLTHP